MHQEINKPQIIRAKLAQFGLSRREQQIAWAVICGYSNQQIAARLCITEQTVKDHLREVFHKMDIRRRGEIARQVLGLSMDDFSESL